MSFIRDKRGNVAIMFALTIPIPIVLCGGALDIARHELLRIKLQDSVDRGVLAAASLTQSQDFETTISDYVMALDFGADVKLAKTGDVSMNARQVSVVAEYDMKTYFLPLIGIDSLKVSAVAEAREAKRNIELSLMLDMSGSMITNNRIGKLKNAAKGFIDQVLTVETREHTTISIVPYAGQVNIGQQVFDRLRGSTSRKHNYSSCFTLTADDHKKSAPDFSTRGQVLHYTQWNFGRKDMNWWWCPDETTSVTYHSNDAAHLKARIDSMVMHDGTGTHHAMQWGFWLLDPASKKITEAAVKSGVMLKKFEARPAPYEDGETAKYIVLMTDGAISDQFSPKDPNRDPFKLPPSNNRDYTSGEAVKRFEAACQQAKSKNIVVFTIGFEINATAQQQMTNCASSPAHFYNVSGLAIDDAFKSISTTLNKLRLTQ